MSYGTVVDDCTKNMILQLETNIINFLIIVNNLFAVYSLQSDGFCNIDGVLILLWSLVVPTVIIIL
jgi:hypothetical protein